MRCGERENRFYCGWLWRQGQCLPGKAAPRGRAALMERRTASTPYLSTTGSAVQSAVEELRALGREQAPRGAPAPTVHGIGCNVARPAEVAALANFAKDQLGTVDMWIK